MTETMKFRVAVPSMLPGGLNAGRSGHFGQCECFTLVDIEDGKLASTRIFHNPPHEQGGCLATVMLLANQDVDVMIVQGIGMRPLMGFRQQGIQVFQGIGDLVQQSIDGLLAGQLPEFSDDHVCQHH